MKRLEDNKKWFTFSNISTIVMTVFVLILFFRPEVKGLVIQRLMKVGLFQPDVPEISEASSVPVQQAPNQQVLFTDQKGNTINLSDQKGKVIFMNFWATWCPPCIAEMPSIDKLYAKYKNNKNVMFIMVDVDGKMEASLAFMKKKNLSLPVYISAGAIPKEYFSGSMPTTVILDKFGNLAFHHLGGADYGNPEVTAFIDKLAK
ncbi:TlpA family protein disulfide reductase [Arcticibacter eurypsychrophilus]|uniref:TlpA family protein disulfide reductase n=1 Tax=Arcticibacter eurypsychrophilus TaxID=1434752 RepID=UPI00084DC246|nr:TlpA family protein disulfide reductase [Arcticibacter eurypsychrophilus]